MYDLGIEGGEVVTPRDRYCANVYADGGRIVYVGWERRQARETADASGLLVMPGWSTPMCT
jgi:dihydroorotase-like cyclic amidohydrolase